MVYVNVCYWLFQTVTFQVIYVTDGEVAYSFYFYEEGAMKSVSNLQFIGLLVNGHADGLDDSSDGSYLGQADINLSLETSTNGNVFCLHQIDNKY
jgi:hypothetical protein